MIINEQAFEAYMERIMDRFDMLEKKIELLSKQKNMLDGEQLLDNQDLCLLLKVTTRTLQSYRSKGILPYIMISKKCYYKSSDVHTLIREHLN